MPIQNFNGVNVKSTFHLRTVLIERKANAKDQKQKMAVKRENTWEDKNVKRSNLDRFFIPYFK